MPGEWIEIREPRTQEAMFANLETGECSWEPPPSSSNANTLLSTPPEDQWWELLDERTSRYYYYNVKSGETRWERPVNNRAKIIALHRLIKRRCDKSVQTESQVKFSCDASTQTYSVNNNSAFGQSLREYLVNEARYAGIAFDYSSNDEDAHGGIGEDWDADDECDEDEIETEEEEEEDDEEYDDEEGAVGDEEDEPPDEEEEDEEDEEEEQKSNYLKEEHKYRLKPSDVPNEYNNNLREIAPRSNKIAIARPPEEEKYDQFDSVKKAEKAFAKENKAKKTEKDEKPAKNVERKQLESYAKENIRRHLKKGGVNLLLKRRESMRRMLIWTKDPIKQPMIATLEANLRQEAIACFKLIQQFCGDRAMDSSFTSSIEVALELLSKGVAHGPLLRDELFVQLCRQTSENPSNQSCEKGLLLITLFLFYFSPSAKFAPYLTTFLEQHALLNSSLKTVAQTALQKRIASFEESDTVQVTGGFTKRPGGINELQMVLDAIEASETGWFGFSLQQTMDKQQQEEEFLNYNLEQYQEDPYRRRKRLLPWLQVYLSELILKLGGSSVEGIFRVAPDFEEMASIRLYIETHSMAENLSQQYECKDVHIFASLLKQWFRQLKSPVIPFHLYHKCLELCESPQCVAIIEQLPAMNRLVLGHLIRFLQVFAAAQNVARTKMDDNNLSMVWSPNILRSPTSSLTPSTLFENTRKEMLFIRSLIQRLDTNFVQGIY